MSISEENQLKETKKSLLYNRTFHKILIGLIVLLISWIVVVNGAAPKKYQLSEGEKSGYIITAPREIKDDAKTRENQEAAAASVMPRYSRDETVTDRVLETIDRLTERVQEINTEEYEADLIASEIKSTFRSENIELNNNQIIRLMNTTKSQIKSFNNSLKASIKKVMDQGITNQSLQRSIEDVNQELSKTIQTDLKDIGMAISSSLITPNMIEDKILTEKARQDARSRASNVVKYEKGQILVNAEDIVTSEQIKLLRELNMLKGEGKLDIPFYIGILGLLLMVGGVFVTYLLINEKEILKHRGDLILIGSIFVLTLLMSWGFAQISVYLIPISFAAILISMLVNVNTAVFMNLALTTVVAIMTNGNINFIYLSLIGGTFAAFVVNKADQRRKLVAAGLAISLVNGLIIACVSAINVSVINVGLLNRDAVSRLLLDSCVGIINGLFSTVLAIGILPFWESTFNVITPFKLLELSNPNQPLIKRMLLEAPGTYHHSLMVGNLAEVATEAIGGNDLLARVAAYYHDVGKLKRPYFFKENQYMDNPHERMTPSLSTLVITSHTKDGVELAKDYGIPLAIRDIILQHHGTTLVAYFFHKAKKSERIENQAKPDSFRYEGPKPTTKEAAVVMLADTVEAAVRSLSDKSEGKIEGLVRKLIKDKLEDGQLDHCELTLKDLDTIADSFMKVFSGCFHGREEYPEIKNEQVEDEYEVIDPLDLIITSEEQSKEGVRYANINTKPAEKISNNR